MKRWTLVLGLIAALSVAGCGNGGGGDAADPQPTTTTSTAEVSGMSWSDLQSGHSKFLSAKCDSQAPDVASCIALQRAMISSFKRDATDLPQSEARSDLLGTIDRYYTNYEKFSDGYCELDPQGLAKPDCIAAAQGLDLSHGTIASIVNREAGTSAEPQASATITTSAAATTTTQTNGVTWKYLQREHAKFLGMKCGSDSKSPSYVVCLGLQNAMIDSFERDATALPPSKARADVLGAIGSYQEAHDKWVAAYCEMDGATATGCITAPLLMSMPYDTIVLVVNREAAAQ